jgi:hypothetical protein
MAQEKKAKKAKEPETTPDENLLYLQKIDKYTISPMSFGKFATLMPKISEVAEEIKTTLPTTVEELTPRNIVMTIMINIDKFIPLVAAYVDAPEEEIRALDAQTGVQLAFAIWAANAKTILDFFVLGSRVDMT